MYLEIDTRTELYSADGNHLELVTYGETPTELMENAAVFEMDWDGNEVAMHELTEMDHVTFRRAAVIIGKAWIDAETKEEMVA